MLMDVGRWYRMRTAFGDGLEKAITECMEPRRPIEQHSHARTLFKTDDEGLNLGTLEMSLAARDYRDRIELYNGTNKGVYVVEIRSGGFIDIMVNEEHYRPRRLVMSAYFGANGVLNIPDEDVMLTEGKRMDWQNQIGLYRLQLQVGISPRKVYTLKGAVLEKEGERSVLFYDAEPYEDDRVLNQGAFSDIAGLASLIKPVQLRLTERQDDGCEK